MSFHISSHINQEKNVIFKIPKQKRGLGSWRKVGDRSQTASSPHMLQSKGFVFLFCLALNNIFMALLHSL